jgi:two-component system, chemotaxis family, sensor kinase CheA
MQTTTADGKGESMIDTEILEDYSSEARELLDEMDHSLMRLEKEGPVPELLNNVFRAVHCIKGSAQYIGLESSSTLTHGVENLLDRLREGMLSLDATIMEFLFRAKDLISTLIEEVAQHRAEKSDISTLMEQLEKILQRPLTTETLPAPAAEAPVTPEQPAADEAEIEPEEPASGFLEADVEGADILGPDDTAALESDDEGILESEDFETTEELREYTASLRKEVDALDEDLLGAEEEALYEPMSYVVREYDEEPLEESQGPSFFTVADMEEEGAAEEKTVAETEPPVVPSEPPIEEALPGMPGFQDAQVIIEGTVPHLLTVSLYLDDFQDGFFHPSEIIPSLLETIDVVQESFSDVGLAAAVEILEIIKNRLTAFEPDTESFSPEEIQELRALLIQLRPYYPAEIFPLGEREFAPPEETPPTPPEETVPEPLPSLEEPVPLGAFAAEAESPGQPLQEDHPQEPVEDHLQPQAVMQPPTTESVLPRDDQRSMLADVDDELLRQFANEFETMFVGRDRPSEASAAATVLPGQLSELAEGLDVSAEESDREIIEIFLAYGLEIMDKLRPLVSCMMRDNPDENDLESCADFINSIRSSATYMDYQKLASFLDDWYENTRSVMDQESISGKDVVFMQDNFDRFQDFLRDLQRALSPQAAPVGRPAAKAAAAVPRQNAPVISTPPTVQEANPSPKEAASPPLQPEPRPVVHAATEPTAGPDPQAEETLKAPAQAAAPVVPREHAAHPDAASTKEAPAYPDAYAARESQEGALVKTMRVDSAKVDTLLNQVGELVVNRSYVEQLSLELRMFHRNLMSVNQVTKKEVQSIKDLALKIGEASIALGRVATDIQEGVMKLRMLPVGQLFNRMPRLIRDLSRRIGKVVNLEVHGADTEVDKRVIEQIYNPLVHLIRNAVDHGIEDREVRKKLGKSEEGLIVLRAYSQGNQVSIDVEDDGAGIDTSAVLEKAIEHRLIEASDATNASSQDIYNFLFCPGFSTSKAVTRTSGRGVGMDVVKKDVEKINGHVDIESWENEGTRISIKIPLTLAIIQTLLIRSVKHVFAIPLTSVREIIQVSPHEITTIEGFEVIKFREETIPVLRISEVFHLQTADAAKQPRFLVLSSAGPRTVGFLVEDLIGEQDVVIKPLADHVFKNRGLAGSTILGDGTIALVLDVMELIEDIISQQRQIAAQTTRQVAIDAQYDMN